MKRAIMIPSTFELGGRTWTVQEPEQATLREGTRLGDEVFNFAEIRIYRKDYGQDIPQEKREITLVHECVHAVLDEMQYPDLSNDEAFVARLAHGLHQILATAQKAKK